MKENRKKLVKILQNPKKLINVNVKYCKHQHVILFLFFGYIHETILNKNELMDRVFGFVIIIGLL